MTDVCFLSLTRILCFAMSEEQIVVIGYLSKKQRNTTGNVTIRKIIISQRMIRVQHGSSDTHTHTQSYIILNTESTGGVFIM